MDVREELAAINQFAKAELTEEQVYAFSVRLCDNEVDRDFERFDPEALEALGRLFLGKSGLFDHQWSALGQTARIYRTEVIREPARVTAAGDEYCWLKGWAYLLRTERNRDLIAEIEGGIKKEVSVGCSMTRRVCSICGAEAGSCLHEKGLTYGDRLCFWELREPTDAYEWSFVAVPAQREAGVLKRFGRETDRERGEAAELRRQAALGRRYLGELRREVVRLAMLAEDDLDGAVFAGAVEKLEEAELLELKRVYGAQAARRFPAPVQLRPAGESGARGDGGVPCLKGTVFNRERSMQMSFYGGIGQWAATFACSGELKSGQVAKISGNGEVGACAAGEAFGGVVLSVARDAEACTVALGGLMTVHYTGSSAPAVGWTTLTADGNGGVQAAAAESGDGREVLIVDVDAAAKTVTFAM